MSTTLQRLATWAVDLSVESIPEDVLRLARLQHLSLAGAVRASMSIGLEAPLLRIAPSRGAVSLIDSERSLPKRDALRVSAALAGGLELDDGVFLGPAGVGGVVAGWTLSKGHSVSDLLVATVAANEVAGRLAAACFPPPRPDLRAAAVHALSTAVAAAKLEGLDANETARAYAMALSSAGASALPPAGVGRAEAIGEQAATGLRSVELASEGMDGPLDLLDDARGWFHAAGVHHPLRPAFTGLGETWLTQALSLGLVAGNPHLQVPVEAVAEILKRHMRAADKRLRPDQIVGLIFRVGAPAWWLDSGPAPSPSPAAVGGTIRYAVAALLAAHESSPAQLDEAWVSARSTQLADLADRVDVRHHWPATVALIRALLIDTAPLFGQLKPMERLQVLRGPSRDVSGGVPYPVDGPEILATLRKKPHEALLALGESSDDLAELDMRSWSLPQPTEVKLYTTRGGWWPERRALGEASAGRSPEVLEGNAVIKFAGQSTHSAELTEAASQALSLPLSADGSELTAILGAGSLRG